MKQLISPEQHYHYENEARKAGYKLIAGGDDERFKKHYKKLTDNEKNQFKILPIGLSAYTSDFCCLAYQE